MFLPFFPMFLPTEGKKYLSSRKKANPGNYCCFKSCNRSLRGAVIQADLSEIHNFVENSYQYDAMELLE